MTVSPISSRQDMTSVPSGGSLRLSGDVSFLEAVQGPLLALYVIHAADGLDRIATVRRQAAIEVMVTGPGLDCR